MKRNNYFGVSSEDVLDYLNDDEIEEFLHARNVIVELTEVIKSRKIERYYLQKGCTLVRTLKLDKWGEEVKALVHNENGFTILDNAIEIMQILNDGLPNAHIRSVLCLSMQENSGSEEYAVAKLVTLFSNNGYEFIKEYIKQSGLDASPKEADFIAEIEKESKLGR